MDRDQYTAETETDAELVAQARHGDTRAFAVLWERHVHDARRYASGVTHAFDADDLVSESYLKILAALQNGKGPTGAFRPYLFVTIRNLAVSWSRAHRTETLDEAEQLADTQTTDASILLEIDTDLTARAFRTLPHRWQEVLWFTEIDGLTPAQAASRLGLSPNSVAVLAYRAREGFRQAWIQAHVDTSHAGSEHLWVLQRIGKSARGGLSRRGQERFDGHLAGCSACTVIASEARDVANHAPLLALTVTVGIVGAAGLRAFVHPTTTPSGESDATAASAATNRVASPARWHGRRLIVAGTAAVVLLTGASVYAVDAQRSRTSSDTAATATDLTSDSPQEPTPRRTAAASPSPSGRPSERPTAVPTSPAKSAAPPSRSTSTPTPLPTTSLPLPGGAASTGDVSGSAPGVLTTAPAITLVDTGNGVFHPIVSGTARPGTVVLVRANSASVTVSTDTDGRWQTPQIPVTGSITVTAVADSLTSATATAHVSGPTLSATVQTNTATIALRGEAATKYQIDWDGTPTGTVRTDGSGSGTITISVPTAGTHTLAAHAVAGTRSGPSAIVDVSGQ